MKSGLAGKVALILGAGAEPGPAIARKLAECGATVALLDAAADQDAGGIDAVLQRHGRIDILINNTLRPAGGAEPLPATAFEAAIDTLLLPSCAALRAVVPVMRANGFGRIVNISSIDYLGLPGKAGVAAAQAGVFGLTRATALEAARDNVTVNTVVLGDVAADGALNDEENERLIRSIPVKRVGTMADVVHAVTFFADETTKYVTGQTFFVCGGKSIHFSMSI